jgi:hypothetical protein
MPRALAILLVLVGGTPAPARAEYVPILPSQIASLVARKARLHVARPTQTRGRGASVALYPGDVVTATGALSFSHGGPPNPAQIEARLPDGTARTLQVAHLSQRPLDYSYRDRKQSFEAFANGLGRDAVRLIELYKQTLERHKWQRPSISDPATRTPVDDWYRLQALRDQFQFLRMRFFAIGYSRPSERSLLEREKDWLPARGEDFITRYAGKLEPEEKKRLQQIYLTMNSLDGVSHLCFKVGQLLEAIEKAGTGADKYKDLEPAHRARLQAEDVAKLHTEVTEAKSKLVVTLTQARARMVALGVKPR